MENEILLTVGAWGAAIAGTAAGLKGLAYLTDRGVLGFRLVRRAARTIVRLAAIGDEESWPNGSTDLPTFLEALHSLVKKILEFLGDDFREWEATRQAGRFR